MKRFLICMALISLLPGVSSRVYAASGNKKAAVATKAAAENPADFVGSDVCATCHAEVAKKFSDNPHSKLALLHNGTGATCESCHGGGKAHVEGGGDVTKIKQLAKLTPAQSSETCLGCHAGAHPNFAPCAVAHFPPEIEIDRLRGENEQLRKELKAAGRGPKHGSNSRKRKTQRKRPGRKAGQGPFTFRQAPADTGTSSEPPIEVPVMVSQCPCCGGELRYERTDEATVTDMPQTAQPKVKSYAVEVRRCERCGQRVRGQHPDVAPDQYGATAHPLGRSE